RDGLIPMSFRAGTDDKHDSLQLVVGQPVTVIVQLRERTKGYVLPNESVVRNSANEPIVWIKSGAERYIPQPVQVRPLDARNVVVTPGLCEENGVVVQGAALIAQIRWQSPSGNTHVQLDSQFRAAQSPDGAGLGRAPAGVRHHRCVAHAGGRVPDTGQADGH